MKRYTKRINQASFEDAIYEIVTNMAVDQRQQVTSLSIASRVPLYEHYFDFMDDGWTHYDALSLKIRQFAKQLCDFKSLKQFTLITGHELLLWHQMQDVKAQLDKLHLEKVTVIVKTKKDLETLDTGWLTSWKNDSKVVIDLQRKWCTIM